MLRFIVIQALLFYMGVDQIFYQLLNQLAIFFFSSHTYILEQIQAPRLIVYHWVSISFCEFYPNFDLDWLIKILNNLDESIHQSFNQKIPSIFCVCSIINDSLVLCTWPEDPEDTKFKIIRIVHGFMAAKRITVVGKHTALTNCSSTHAVEQLHWNCMHIVV